MNICEAPAPPILPEGDNIVTPAPAPVTCIFAVDAINVPAELMIFPATAVILTAPAAVELVFTALAPKITSPVAAVKLKATPLNTALTPVDVTLLVIA